MGLETYRPVTLQNGKVDENALDREFPGEKAFLDITQNTEVSILRLSLREMLRVSLIIAPGYFGTITAANHIANKFVEDHYSESEVINKEYKEREDGYTDVIETYQGGHVVEYSKHSNSLTTKRFDFDGNGTWDHISIWDGKENISYGNGLLICTVKTAWTHITDQSFSTNT